jgi:hypothetical protein
MACLATKVARHGGVIAAMKGQGCLFLIAVLGIFLIPLILYLGLGMGQSLDVATLKSEGNVMASAALRWWVENEKPPRSLEECSLPSHSKSYGPWTLESDNLLSVSLSVGDYERDGWSAWRRWSFKWESDPVEGVRNEAMTLLINCIDYYLLQREYPPSLEVLLPKGSNDRFANWAIHRVPLANKEAFQLLQWEDGNEPRPVLLFKDTGWYFDL